MTPWYIAQAVLALIALAALGRMVQRDARISRARRRENVATPAWIATQADLDAAKAEARDVIDAAALPLSKSPAAQRIRNQIADNECRRFRDELDQWGA